MDLMLLRLICFLFVFLLRSSISYKDGEKCYNAVNLVFVLDASGSIDPDTWKTEMNNVNWTIHSFTATEKSGNQFAVIQFNETAKVIQPLTTNGSYVIETLYKLDDSSRNGHSYLDAGLAEAVKIFEMLPQQNDGTQNLLLVLTDGFMTYRNGEDIFTLLEAQTKRLEAKNVTTFVGGFGKLLKESTLQFVSSSPASSHVFTKENTIKITEALKTSTERPCKDGEACESVKVRRIGQGCYKDNQQTPRPLPDLIFSDRNPSSATPINWAGWDSYLPGLVCRCAQAVAQRKRTIFGLQYYGECWSSESRDTYAKDGPAADDKECLSLGYQTCNETSAYCVGSQFHNYVYSIV